MRETPLSNCERQFILDVIKSSKRIDGRGAYDYRKIKIWFGIDRGCCQVKIGETRVMAQVSCEVTPPKQNRPNEGILFTNVELSPMACPSFEVGRQSEFAVELSRQMERCLKESRCLDTESLCILAGEKVWTVRVDIHVLNHEGNITDCASIAAIGALVHFRRPDVTVSGEEVTVHPVSERDPVPLSVHHMPICVTFAFFHQGTYLLVDPTHMEEKVMDGKMIIGMNKHREICCMLQIGQQLLQKEQVLRCSNIAAVKVAEITELIHKALENDRAARLAGEKFGFAESVERDRVTVAQADSRAVNMEGLEEEAAAAMEEEDDEEDVPSHLQSDETDVKVLGRGLAVVGSADSSQWLSDDEEDEDKTEEAAPGKGDGGIRKGTGRQEAEDMEEGDPEAEAGSSPSPAKKSSKGKKSKDPATKKKKKK